MIAFRHDPVKVEREARGRVPPARLEGISALRRFAPSSRPRRRGGPPIVSLGRLRQLALHRFQAHGDLDAVPIRSSSAALVHRRGCLPQRGPQPIPRRGRLADGPPQSRLQGGRLRAEAEAFPPRLGKLPLQPGDPGGCRGRFCVLLLFAVLVRRFLDAAQKIAGRGVSRADLRTESVPAKRRAAAATFRRSNGKSSSSSSSSSHRHLGFRGGAV
mmetsp:Transcript_28578/g.84142  ORF Transcript_28578/g.84142 Transcript_28578/m.84142 type:complete len:215 (+) Transcript_28578:1109-1753(+)